MQGERRYRGRTPLWIACLKGGFGQEYGCPYGDVGDRLWVRETWCYYGAGDAHLGYKATDEICPDAIDKWKPSIYMPRAASRIMLEVTEVRVQRLQDISEEDAIAEGIPKDDWFGLLTVKRDFQELWNAINEKRGYGWDSNPWVWAVSFEVLLPTPLHSQEDTAS